MATVERYAAKSVFDPPAYSQAIKVTGAQTILFIAGQVAYDDKGGPAHQRRLHRPGARVFQALKAQVEAGGGTMQNIVKVNTYLTDARTAPSSSRCARSSSARRARVDAGRGGRPRPARVADRGRGHRGHLSGLGRAMADEINPFIFRAYDVRGKVGRDVVPEVFEPVGRAYGTLVRRKGGRASPSAWTTGSARRRSRRRSPAAAWPRAWTSSTSA